MKKDFLLGVLLLLTSSLYAQEYDVSAIRLDQAVEIGIENNLTLKRSQLNLLNIQAGLLEANGQRFPSLSASSSARYNWGRSINPVTNFV